MDIVGVISDGIRIGFIINDVFIDKEYESMVLAQIPKQFDIEFGDKCEQGVVLGSTVYMSVFPYSIFKLPHDIVSEFLFIQTKVSPEGIDYIIYDNNFNQIGRLLSQDNIYKSSTINILLLEIQEKNRGTGTKVVNFLRGKGYDLVGFSLRKAHSFWERNGAEFGKNDRFILRRL